MYLQEGYLEGQKRRVRLKGEECTLKGKTGYLKEKKVRGCPGPCLNKTSRNRESFPFPFQAKMNPCTGPAFQSWMEVVLRWYSSQTLSSTSMTGGTSVHGHVEFEAP